MTRSDDSSDPPSALKTPIADRKLVDSRAAELIAHQAWSRERLRQFQDEKLREMLRRAVATSRFHRDRVGELVARQAPLSEFPAMTKSMLMENFDSIVTDSRVTRSVVERHLSGDEAAALLFGEYRAVATGGTTGERGVFIYDRVGWETAVANLLRFQRLIGVLPTTRTLGIGAPSPIHLSNRFNAELRSELSAAPRLAVTMPLSEVVAGLNSYQPEILSTYASYLRRLAEEQLAGRLCIHPRLMRSVAETLTEDIRDLVRAVWDVPLINGYAATEIGVIGLECNATVGIHVAEDLYVLEVVDANNIPVPQGVRGAKVLVTPLANSVLPLVRYELSDVLTMASGPCACGSPFVRIAHIDGRREELLKVSVATGGSIDIPAGRLGSFLMRIAAIRQYQFEQIPGGIRVRIAPTPGCDLAKMRGVAEQTIRDALASLGALAPNVEIEVIDRIERVGGGAKERLVADFRPVES